MNFRDLRVKISLGFRPDQKYSIEAEEAHKAYYAFMNQNKRVIFNDGLAVRGEDIRSIEPDLKGTMGWNESHQLDGDDWNEIRRKGVEQELRKVLSLAKGVAQTEPPEKMNLPLSEIMPLLS